MPQKPDAELPLTVTIYRGVSSAELMSFIEGVFFSINVPGKYKYTDSPNHFLLAYGLKQSKSETEVFHRLPDFLLVRTGKPHVNTEIEYLSTRFNEYTDNFCTFELLNDEALYMMILDENKMDCCLKSGMYRASLSITPASFFPENYKHCGQIIRMDIQAVMQLKLTIEELESLVPLSKFKSKKDTKDDKISTKLPTNLKEFINDFRKVFNI